MAVAVLLTGEGDHVPAIPSTEVVGNTGAAAPLQIVYDAGLNVGTVAGRTVIVLVAVMVLLQTSVKVHVSIIFPPFGPGGGV